MAVFAESSIQGIVLDPSGGAVPDAGITVVLEATGLSRSAHSGTDGRYRIPGLPIGIYTIRCEHAGFRTSVVKTVTLSINQALEQRIALMLASADSRIEVSDQPDALAATAVTASVALGGEVLEETPSQNRSYLGVVLLAPGVSPSAGSNALRTKAGTRSASPDSGFSFAGMRGRNNSLLIDGLENRDETTGGSRVSVGQEAVQEFRVTASQVAPEAGGGAGGNLNVVTLSGGNRFHGDVNLFASDSFVEARNPEGDTGAVPQRRQYQPEAALNGPFRRDRTFFATTIELERETSQESSEMTGIGTRSAVNAALATPAFRRAAVSSVSEGLFPSDSASTEFSLKLNHRLNSSNELQARYAVSHAHVKGEVLGSENFSERSARGSSRNSDQALAAGWQAVRGAHFVSDLRMQLARRTVELTPNAHGALLEVPGVVSFGQSWQLDANRTEDHAQLVESVSVVRGAHLLGFGGSLQTVRLDARMANRFGGIFIFPTLAALTRGTPDVWLQAFGDPHTHYSTEPVGLWAQDQWQPAHGLTVVGGVRYEAQRLPTPFASPSGNFAPRLGVAWQPGGRAKWVLRAGFGLFHDRYPLGFLNDALQKNGVNGFEQYAAGADAARAFAASAGGTVAVPLTGLAHIAYRPDAHFPSTYSRKFTAGAERGLGADQTLTVEYMNVAGYHLPRLRSAVLEQSAHSTYEGVSVTLRRRLNRELTYLLAYTGGSAHDDASDFDEQPSNPLNTGRDWARSRQYQAHRVVASAIFEMPGDEVEGMPGWFKALANKLDFAPVVSAGSPRPVNALETTDTDRTGAYPITARPAGLGRNPFYVRGIFSVDLRVTKSFAFWKEHGLWLFGVGIYNLTNHTNALRVSPYYTGSYRGLVETLNARQVQFSFQWEF